MKVILDAGHDSSHSRRGTIDTEEKYIEVKQKKKKKNKRIKKIKKVTLLTLVSPSSLSNTRKLLEDKRA
jgi:hypothetical protein